MDHLGPGLDWRLAAITATLTWSFPALMCALGFGIAAWQYRDEPLAKLAALFACKPLISTPLFALVVGGVFGPHELVLFLPGALLTLLLVGYGFRPLMAHPSLALVLLAGDALRWILPYLIIVRNLPLFVPALAWTSGYAALCWYMARRVYAQGLAPTPH